jgi:WD40 repeat protein
MAQQRRSQRAAVVRVPFVLEEACLVHWLDRRASQDDNESSSSSESTSSSPSLLNSPTPNNTTSSPAPLPPLRQLDETAMAATQPFDPGHNDRVTVVHTNFNGTKILTGSIDHRIKVWDRDSKTGEKTLLDTFTAHDADIKDVSNDMPFLRPICQLPPTNPHAKSSTKISKIRSHILDLVLRNKGLGCSQNQFHALVARTSPF